MSKFMNFEVPRVTAGWVPVEEAMAAVLERLSPGPYLLGKSFSAADVLYATMFAMFAQAPFLPKSARLQDYVARVTARPAFARALARESA
jgi:glutathione S-transferase